MITESAYAVVILMVAITTVVAPPILRILFRKETGFAEAIAAATE
jgi:hypothetical protein